MEKMSLTISKYCFTTYFDKDVFPGYTGITDSISTTNGQKLNLMESSCVHHNESNGKKFVIVLF